MAWELDICGDEAISMPANEKCDECAEFAERLADVEDLLRGFARKNITMIDSEGTETTATVAASVAIVPGV